MPKQYSNKDLKADKGGALTGSKRVDKQLMAGQRVVSPSKNRARKKAEYDAEIKYGTGTKARTVKSKTVDMGPTKSKQKKDF